MNLSHAFGPKANSAPNNTLGVTEVVLPDTGHIHLILPTLAHMSRHAGKRWFTWFPPAGVTKPLMKEFGFKLENIRLIHTKSSEQQFWYAWEALAEGNSQTVVASPGKLNEKRLAQLENAACVGQCSALLVRYR